MADMLTDLLIYIAIGIMTFAIGAILRIPAPRNVLYQAIHGNRAGMFRCRVGDSNHRWTCPGDL